MDNKKTARFTRQREVLKHLEEAARRELAKLVPDIELLDPGSIDQGLIDQIDKMIKRARIQLDTAKNGRA